MGWSCAALAGWVLDAWSGACFAACGSSNVFADKGERYFYETSRKEHGDGAITGTIWKFVGEDKCRKSGSFRIEADGTVSLAPAWLKKHSPSMADLAKRYHETYGRLTPAERIANNHAAFAAGAA